MIPPRRFPPALAIPAATSLTLIAGTLQGLLKSHAPGAIWLLFYPAVYLSSWLGGLIAGVTSAVVSIAIVWLWMLPGALTLPVALLATAVFACVCGLICYSHERGRRSEQRLRILFARSADAIIVADMFGCCRAINPSACVLLGYPRANLIGQSIFGFVAPQDSDRVKQALDLARQGGIDRLDIHIVNALAESIPVELSTNALSGDEWLINIRDSRPRKEAEESLLQVRAELYEAQRLAQIGNWQWDMTSDQMKWSPELFRIYRWDPAKAPPSIDELEVFYAAQSRESRKTAMQEVMTSGKPYTAEREIVFPDGMRRWILVTNEGIRGPDGKITKLRGTAQDVTDRKRMELQLIDSQSELREIAAHRELEREEERKAIAREIHDELGQLLAAMRMNAVQIQAHCSPAPAARVHLDDLSKLVQRMFEVVRSLATSLRPAALDLGLVSALEWLVEDFSIRWEIPCKLQILGDEPDLRDALSTAVFRVVQESLTNAAKHAQAHQIDIQLSFEAQLVRVSIRDDGCGFIPEQTNRPGHFGLIGMRERILSLQGHIDIKTAPGQGTQVAFEVPINDSHTLTLQKT